MRRTSVNNSPLAVSVFLLSVHQSASDGKWRGAASQGQGLIEIRTLLSVADNASACNSSANADAARPEKNRTSAAWMDSYIYILYIIYMIFFPSSQ